MPGRDIITDARNSFTYFCSGENSIWKTTDDGENVRPGASAVYKMNIPNKVSPEECSVSSMVVHPLNKDILYSVHFRQAFTGKLMRSTDGGATWTEHGKVVDAPSNMTLSKAGVTQFSLLIDPDNVNKFYVCLPSKPLDDITETKLGNVPEPFGVYRSVDGGVTFNKINTGFTSVTNDKLNVQKLMFDPVNPGVLYAAVSRDAGGLYRLDKNSNSWQKVNTPSGVTDINDVYITKDKLYISSGVPYNTNANIGGVWVSENRGNTWTQIFKSRCANHIRVAPYDANVLLVSIPSSKMINPGLYRSFDGGSKWTKINMGNPQSDRLNDVEFDIHQQGLYWCSTYGAGFYKGTDASLLNSHDIVTGSVAFNNPPTSVNKNDDLEVTLDYTASDDLQVFAMVYTPEGLFLKEAHQNINTGSGTANLTIQQDGNWSIKNDYLLAIGIRPVDGTFNSHLDFKTVNFNVKLADVSIADNNYDSTNNIIVYPNPVNDKINITGVPQGIYKISIYDMSGKVINTLNKDVTSTIELNAQQLESGIYIIQLQNNGFIKNLRFVKE